MKHIKGEEDTKGRERKEGRKQKDKRGEKARWEVIVRQMDAGSGNNFTGMKEE